MEEGYQTLSWASCQYLIGHLEQMISRNSKAI